MKAYDTDGKLNSWRLEGGVWTPEIVVVPGSSTESAAASTIKLDRGKGVWLTRADEDLSNPIYLVGAASTDSVVTTLDETTTAADNKKWNIVASPSVEPVDIAVLLKGNESEDEVVVPTAGAPKNYQYDSKDGCTTTP